MYPERHSQTKISTIILISSASLIIAFLVPPIPQDPDYHQFADQRTIFGISNYWDVISNAPFLLIGLLGLNELLYRRSLHYPQSLFWSYLVFFAGTLLVGFGSGYYHLDPDNETLVWDRLPMTFAFMAFFSIVIGEFISEQVGKILLLPLLLVGAFSVFYWIMTERSGAGDLRPYGLVQFLPMLLIPLIIIWFRSGYTPVKYLWLMMFAYLAAKIFEFGDVYIYHLTGCLSGHTIKHLLAALAPFFLLMGLRKRVRLR